MAMQELTEEQLDDMSDEELEQRVQDERNDSPSEEDKLPEDEPTEDDEDAEVEEDEPSDDDDDSEDSDDEVEVEDKETSEEDDGQLDGDPETETEETKTTTTDTPELPFKEVKVDGKMIPINSIDELYALASGGANLTQKYQRLAGGKKTISMMEKHGLTDADISLLIEARNGSKDALASLVKQSGIDSLDVTDEVTEGYVPGAYVPTDVSINLKSVQDEISQDQEYSITQNVVNNLMDEKSQGMLVENPDYIRGLHMDIKNGAYEPTQAKATKLKLIDGGRLSDMEYYIQAAQSEQAEVIAPNPTVPQARKVVDKTKKRAAGSTRAKTPPSARKSAEDMSDEELDAYRETIMEGR